MLGIYVFSSFWKRFVKSICVGLMVKLVEVKITYNGITLGCTVVIAKETRRNIFYRPFMFFFSFLVFPKFCYVLGIGVELLEF